MTRTWILLACGVFISGCCSCPDFPHERADTPERFAENFIYGVENECTSELYELLSPRTRDEYGYTMWLLGWRDLSLPPMELDGPEINVRKLVLNGETLAFVPNTKEGEDPEKAREYFWIFEDMLEEGDPDRPRTLNILLVQETPDQLIWRLGLQEHIDRNIPIYADY